VLSSSCYRGFGLLEPDRFPPVEIVFKSSTSNNSLVRSVLATFCHGIAVRAPSRAQSKFRLGRSPAARTSRNALAAPSLRRSVTDLTPTAASMAVDFGPRPGRESGGAITAADRLDEPFMVADKQRLWGDECHDASKGRGALDSFHRCVSFCEAVPLHDFGPVVVRPVMVALPGQEAGLRRGPPANDRSTRQSRQLDVQLGSNWSPCRTGHAACKLTSRGRMLVAPQLDRESIMEANASAGRREPWNKGKIVGQKAPFKLKDIWALRVRLLMASRVRELALLISA